MPPEDDPEDELTVPDRLLPAEDRLWRHPSELGSELNPPMAFSSERSARAGRRAPDLTALVGACLAGAIVTFGVTWLIRPWPDKAQLTTNSIPSTTSVLTAFGKNLLPTERLAKQMAPSIATLRVQRDGTWTTASALWIDDQGTLAAAAPTVARSTRLVIIGADGINQIAFLAGTDPATGIAALFVDRTAGTPIHLADKSGRAGEACAVIGAGRSDASKNTGDATVASVVIRSISLRALLGDQVIHDAIQLDRQIPVDATGGALVDMNGGLLGLVVGNSTDRSLGTAVDGATVMSAARDLRDRGAVQRAWLGVEAIDVDPDEASILGISGGANLTGITAGSPAERAGLQEGDVITSVAGATIENASDLVRTLRTHSPGEATEIVVTRGNETAKVTATLGAR